MSPQTARDLLSFYKSIPNLPIPDETAKTLRSSDPEEKTAHPPAKPRSRQGRGLRIEIHSPGSRVLMEANLLLSRSSVEAAVHSYTEVLGNRDPGHPCAFLNRSLCYLLLGQPELAVADAWRAILGAFFALEVEPRSVQARQLISFKKATDSEREYGEVWTVEPGRFVARRLCPFLENDLASIDLRPKPATKGFTRLKAITENVKAKAYYRLAVALFACGGGAMKTSLSIIDEAKSKCCINRYQTSLFDALGNVVLAYMEKLLLLESALGGWGMTLHQGKQNTAETESKGLRILFDSEYTTISRKLYSWDNHSLNRHNFSQPRPNLVCYLAEILRNCERTYSVKPGKAWEYKLKASEKVCAEHVFFAEEAYFVVSSDARGVHHLLCQNCGCLLDVPQGARDRAVSKAEELKRAEEKEHMRRRIDSRFGSSPIFLDKDNSQERYHNSQEAQDSQEKGDGPREKTKLLGKPAREETNAYFGLLSPLQSSDGLTPELPPSPHSSSPERSDSTKISNSVDFQVCPSCFEACYCSLSCHMKMTDKSHQNICGKQLPKIMDAVVLPHTWLGLRPPAFRNILSQLMLRVLAATRYEDDHPLTVPWLHILSGNFSAHKALPGLPEPLPQNIPRLANLVAPPPLSHLFPSVPSLNVFDPFPPLPPPPSTNVIPWSFDANVRRPICALLVMGGPALALDVRYYDGWVLNTIAAKLDAAMRVTRGPRFRKQFDEEGRLVGAGLPGGRGEEEEIWVGSVFPLETLLRPEELERGDGSTHRSGSVDAKVRLRECDGRVECRATREVRDMEVLMTDGGVTVGLEEHVDPLVLSGGYAAGPGVETDGDVAMDDG